MNPDDIFGAILSDFLNNKNEHFLFLLTPAELAGEASRRFFKNTDVIDLKNNYAPLKPFLQILSLYPPQTLGIPEFVYPLQRDSFESYFKTGEAAERKDVVIWTEETYYEVMRLKNAVAGMIARSVSSSFVVLNAQKLGKEAVDIIGLLEQSDFKGKLIFCFDMLCTAEAPDYIGAFLQKIGMNANYFEITGAKALSAAPIPPAKDALPDFETLYRSIKNCRTFLVLSEACALAKRIDDSAAFRNFPAEQKRRLSMEMGLSYFYAGSADEAAFYLGNVIEYGGGDALEYRATFYLSQVFFTKNDNLTALRYADGTKKRLENNKNSEFYAYADMMEYIITERTTPKTSIKTYSAVASRLKKLGLINNFIHTALTVPWTLIYNNASRKKIMAKIEEVEGLAKEIDNQFALSAVCHWKGILLSLAGNSEEALTWYEKCIAIRTEIGQVAPVIKIRNGIAYEFLARAEYKKSYDLINGFIAQLLESSDYPEIVITLGNAAKSLFYARRFEQAYPFFLTILKLLYLFGLENNTFYHFVPEYNDILAYKTLIELSGSGNCEKQLTKAKIALNNLNRNGKPFSPIEETMKYFLTAAVNLKEGKLRQSVKDFAETEKFLKKTGSAQGFRTAFLYFEFAVLLQQNGHEKEAEKYKKLGFERAAENNFTFYTQGKRSAAEVSLAGYAAGGTDFDAPNIDLALLEQKAEKVRLVSQLHKRLREAQFLNKIMGLSANTTHNAKYASSVVHVIFDYLMAEAVFIAEKTNEKNWGILASVSRTERNSLSDAEWDALAVAAEAASEGCIYYDRQQNVIFSNLLKFEFVGAIVIVLQKNTRVSSAELDTINIAIANIQAQLVMLRQHEHLLVIASTDMLSMLKNRRALQDRLAIESEMLRSYKNKQDMAVQITIAFIDLDNFKHYNDSYGHEAGDLLIAKFAQLLKTVYRQIDFIARFGGDEFVVLMPNTDCEEARSSAERLHEALKAAGYFIHDLESLLGKKIRISPGNYLNFSCGICSNFDIDDPTDMERTMINADHALYYSKRNKKGVISVWSETKCVLQPVGAERGNENA
ncbi:MAG: GGDEF domain-containing protein [Treponema sp.]